MNDNHSLEFLRDLKYKVMAEGEVLTRRSTLILLDKMIEMKQELALADSLNRNFAAKIAQMELDWNEREKARVENREENNNATS